MIDVDLIKRHFDSVYPEEGCGLVIKNKEGDLEWVPSKNISDSPETSFEVEERVFVHHLIYSDIQAIVHNHVDSDSKPSQLDIDACHALNIPYWIFSYPKMKLTVVYPEK